MYGCGFASRVDINMVIRNNLQTVWTILHLCVMLTVYVFIYVCMCGAYIISIVCCTFPPLLLSTDFSLGTKGVEILMSYINYTCIHSTVGPNNMIVCIRLKLYRNGKLGGVGGQLLSKLTVSEGTTNTGYMDAQYMYYN